MLQVPDLKSAVLNNFFTDFLSLFRQLLESKLEVGHSRSFQIHRVYNSHLPSQSSLKAVTYWPTTKKVQQPRNKPTRLLCVVGRALVESGRRCALTALGTVELGPV